MAGFVGFKDAGSGAVFVEGDAAGIAESAPCPRQLRGPVGAGLSVVAASGGLVEVDPERARGPVGMAVPAAADDGNALLGPTGTPAVPVAYLD